MSCYSFLEPLDVLILRGNKMFGAAGSYGETMVVPWPSVAAGALRSRILADDDVDFASFRAGKVVHPTIGTPAEPGTFRLIWFALAIVRGDSLEELHPLPADLVLHAGSRARMMQPLVTARGLQTSNPTAALPVLAVDQLAKPVNSAWLNRDGWQQYLAGNAPDDSGLIQSDELWCLESRVGIGKDESTGRADDGKLFSTQALTLMPGTGFVVGVAGAELPADGLLRFGGDGRAVSLRQVPGFQPEAPDYEKLSQDGRAKVVLTTPAIFEGGWQLPGVSNDGTWQLGGVKGRLVAASVPRAEMISGWDLAKSAPKPAQRVAPVGSVYWLENLSGTPDQLRKLAEQGLWGNPGDNTFRRAEGFNRFTFAVWHN